MNLYMRAPARILARVRLCARRLTSIFLWAFLFAVTLATAADSQDPYIERMRAIKSDFARLFLVPEPGSEKGSIRDLLGIDPKYTVVSFKDPKYIAFLEKLKAFKKDLEVESNARSGQKLESKGLNALTEVSAEYLDLQAKLYMNYARVVHLVANPVMSQYSFGELDKLNLLVHKKVGLPFATHSELKRQYNIRHKTIDRVELFVTEEDRQAAEYFNLVEPKDRLGYAKLIQFATLRETMVNRWAIRRLLPIKPTESKVPSCGKDFLSFKTPGAMGKPYALDSIPAFKSLEILDRYTELQKHKANLVAASLDKPVSDATAYAALARAVFNEFEEFKTEIVPAMAPADLSAFFTNTVAPQMLQIEEASWKAIADQAFIDSNFPADDLSSGAVAARFSEIAFDMHRRYLLETLHLALKDQDIKLAENSPAKSLKKIAKIITAQTDPLKTAWVASRTAEFKKTIDSAMGYKFQVKMALSRMDEMLNLIEDSAISGFKADHLKEEIDGWELKKINLSRKPFLPVKPLLPVELQTIPAAGNLRFTLYPWTPEQMRRFFYKKLEDYGKREDEETQEHRILTAAGGNPAQMETIGKFFDYLNEDFQRAVQAAGIQKLTPANSPLATVISSAAVRSYNDFKKAIRTKPVNNDIAPIPELERDFTRTNFITKKDNAVGPKIHIPVNKTAYRAGEKDRKDAEWHYISLLQLMGVKISVNPVDLPGLVPSILDQKLLAEVLIHEAYAKAPILRIEAQDVDGTFYTMDEDLPASRTSPLAGVAMSRKKKITGLSHMSVAYDVKTGKFDRKQAGEILGKLVATAARNGAGKMETFCSANPRDPDNNDSFKLLFKSSTSLREVLADSPKIKKWDDELKKATRTQTQKIMQDIVDPICIVAMIVILCIIAIQFAPIVWGMVIGGGAAGGIGATGIVAQIFIGNFGPVSALFYVQTIMMVTVNYYQLPAELSYQMQLADSHIGLFSKPVASREHITAQREEINSAQNWTTFAVVADSLGLAWSIQMARKSLGIVGAKALSRLSGGPVKGFETVATIKKPGIGGIKSRADDLVKNIEQFTPKYQHGSTAIVRQMLSAKLGKTISDPEMLKNAYKAQIAADKVSLEKLEKLAEALKAQTAPTGHLLKDLTNGYIARLKMMIPPRKGFKMWFSLIARNAYKAIQNGKIPLYWEKMPEMTNLLRLAQAQEILQRMKHFDLLIAKLDESSKMFKDGVLVDAKNFGEMEFHFSRMSDSELFFHQKLFKKLKKSDPSEKWTRAVSTFKDFKIVNSDIKFLDESAVLERDFALTRTTDAIFDENGVVLYGKKITETPADDYDGMVIDVTRLVTE